MKNKNKLIVVVSLTFIAFSCNGTKKISSSQEPDANQQVFERGEFTDERDNKKYQTVQLGDQWWMVNNLDYQSENAYYYNDNVRNSGFYGLLYTWEAAKNACPDGWKLPSDQDWMKLEKSLGMPESLLRETEHRGTIGTDLKQKGSVGFNGLLGGWRDIHGDYYEMDVATVFWTSTERSKVDAWGRGLEAGSPAIIRRTFGKTYGFSVRCIQE